MKNQNSEAAEKKPLPRILKNKWYLYMTEFFAGMSVMAVELGASRLLAPYFSSSQIVWTIIIGTIMIAMALGNIYGGRSADKNPDPDKLYGRILIAAVWIAAVPFIGKLAIAAIAGLLVVTVNTNFLIWAAFITCMVVFVYPLFLLGTVTPSLVKYTVDSLDDSGRTVGTLGAANTIGSIIGTFVPTFISIPAVGTAVTFLIFAGIMLIIGLVYFISSKRGAAKTAIASPVSCGCHSILWQIPHLSKENRHRFVDGQWTQDSWTKGKRIFVRERQGESKTYYFRWRSGTGSALRYRECSCHCRLGSGGYGDLSGL